MTRSLPLHRDLAGLAGWLALCLAAVAGNGAATAIGVDGWYQTLARPSFNPPDWLFAPVWSVLFALMAIAAWRVWRTDHPDRLRALALFGLHLILNLLWSVLFFGLQQPALALADLVVLWLAILAVAVAFARIDRVAGLLLAPYLAWVSFAGVLNAAIVVLN